jgi:hypothetical protein
MIDYKELVDNLRSFLAVTERSRSEELESWANDYLQWCKQTNDRLRRCKQYLQKGLRGEAIHLAEEDPELLDVIATLDFPELPEWRQVCVQHSLPEPPPLLIDIARSINETYAEAEPLTNLLARHRLMGLARAPLAEHLMVLRRLAERDPATAYWEEDVKVFEKARLNEIRVQIRGLVQRNDFETLANIRAEIEGTQWRVPVPRELQQMVSASDQAARTGAGEKMLQQLIPEFRAAYKARNLAQAKEVAGRWDQTIQTTGMTLTGALEEQVRPIMAWLEGEEQKNRQSAEFEGACAVLQHALDADAPDADLDRAFRLAGAFAMPLPPALEKLYHERRSKRAAARKHRRNLTYAGIAAAVVVVGSVSAVALSQMNRTQQAQLWARTLKDAGVSLVADGQLDKAHRVEDSLAAASASVRQSPEVVQAVADLDACIAHEEQRSKAFLAALEQFRQGVGGDAAAARAQELAKSSAEKQQYELLKGQIMAARSAQQEQIDAQFTKEVAALAERVDAEATAQLMTSDAAAYTQKLAALKALVDKLATRAEVSGELRSSSAVALRTKISGKESALVNQGHEKSEIEAIAAAGGSCDARITALKDYVQSIPDGARSVDFRQALERAAAEKAIEAWIQLCKKWEKSPMPVTLEDAKVRVEELQKYLSDFPKSPWAGPATEYGKYLDRGVQALAPDGPWKQGLTELMKHPLMQELYVIQTSDKKTYYVPEKPQLKADSLGYNFLAYKTTNLDSPARVALGGSVTPVNMAADVAPQKLFADATLNQIDRLDVAGFSDFGPMVAASLVASKVNPVLKGQMLLQIIELSKDSFSGSLAATYGRIDQQLTDMHLHNENWIDPENPVSDVLVKKLEAVFRDVPDSKAIRQNSASSRDTLLAGLRSDIIGEAVVLRVGGQLQVLGAMPVDLDLAAYAVPLGEITLKDNVPELRLVARRKGGQWTFDHDGMVGTPEGAGLFLRPLRN